jgi:hypothetical protein
LENVSVYAGATSATQISASTNTTPKRLAQMRTYKRQAEIFHEPRGEVRELGENSAWLKDRDRRKLSAELNREKRWMQ